MPTIWTHTRSVSDVPTQKPSSAGTDRTETPRACACCPTYLLRSRLGAEVVSGSRGVLPAVSEFPELPVAGPPLAAPPAAPVVAPVAADAPSVALLEALPLFADDVLVAEPEAEVVAEPEAELVLGAVVVLLGPALELVAALLQRESRNSRAATAASRMITQIQIGLLRRSSPTACAPVFRGRWGTRS